MGGDRDLVEKGQKTRPGLGTVTKLPCELPVSYRILTCSSV